MRYGYKGILQAMQCPMKENFEIDYDELQKFANWLTSFKGVNGLVTNGHTGEIFSLSAKERAEVTKAVVEAVGNSRKAEFLIFLNLPLKNYSIKKSLQLHIHSNKPWFF